MSKVLAIDPSSTLTGYAVLIDDSVNGLLEAGLLRPAISAAAMDYLPEWLRQLMDGSPLAAYRRMYSMIHELEEVIEEHQPDRIVVEVPSGKPGTGSKRGAKSSLAVYGAAAGMMLEACNRMRPCQVVPVTELQWTAGAGDKTTRQFAVAALYQGKYDSETDKGGDMSDAIGIGRWWLVVEQVRHVAVA